MRDDQTIDDLAGAISDRRPVDWDAIQAPDRDESALIGWLRTINRVSSAYRAPSAGQPAPELRPGTVWGSLRIAEKIGEGAYGQVYRAWDLKLERAVALKLIAESPRAADAPNAVQEGRLLARVRHPNVVTVFGADRVDGRTGIWMELVDGNTLDQEMLARGTIAASEVTAIGRDLCRALAAVHDAGLLHRDIKAQNVVREPGGRVVLMDFGTGREPLGSDDSAGAAAGTPLYLAPELFDGAPSSVASDIYSTGVLLYHLATGAYPVTGRSLSEIRAAHRKNPSAAYALPAVPRPLARVIGQALARNPRERFTSATEFADALDRVATRGRRIRRRLGWAAAGIAAATAAAVAVTQQATPGPPLPVQRFTLPAGGDIGRGLALSADGSKLAYIVRAEGMDQLMVRSLGEFDGNAIYSATSLALPFFSPDGQWIGINASGSATRADRLIKIPAGGGPMVPVANRATNGGRWRADGTIVFGSAGRIWTVPDAGGIPVELLTDMLDPGEVLLEPDVLPSGAILATDVRRNQPSRLVRVTPDGDISTIEDNAKTGRYSATGHILFVRDSTIFVRPVDAVGVATGPSVAISEAGYTGDFAVSGSGALVYSTLPGEVITGLGASWATRGETTTAPVPFPADAYWPFGWQLSPDGTRVYATLPATRGKRIDGKQRSRIWIGDLESGVLSQLTFDDTIPLTWSPDSRSIAVKRSDGSVVRTWVDGSGPDMVLLGPQPFNFGNRGTWSPDGTALVVQRAGDSTNTGIDLWSMTFASKEAVGVGRPSVAAYAASRFNEFSPVFSPDSRWVAYQSDETGRNEIYIRPFPGPGSPVQISRDGGRLPKWQGREIFYSRKDDTGSIIEAATVELAPSPRVTSRTIALRAPEFVDFDVTRDGQRFLLLVGKTIQPRQLNLTLNWPSELRGPQ